MAHRGLCIASDIELEREQGLRLEQPSGIDLDQGLGVVSLSLGLHHFLSANAGPFRHLEVE